jgi:hypothetical protein
MDADTKSILFNVIGGIIVGFLTLLVVWCRDTFHSFHLQRLLGFSFSLPARIAYGQLVAPPLINKSTGGPHIFTKPPRKGGGPTAAAVLSVSAPISECEVRGSAYLSCMLASASRKVPILISDVDASALVDSNFLALGGVGSNYKTADIFSSNRNIFLKKDGQKFVWISGKELALECSGSVDHGIILRIKPSQFPDKSWIVCAGLSEWGTSGAAWFLANKWHEILRKKQSFLYPLVPWKFPDFLGIVRVIPGQDESADLTALYVAKNGVTVKVI